MQDALAAIEKDLGVKFQLGGAKFTDVNATISVQVATTAPTGQAQTREALDFALFAESLGFEKSDLGKTFRQRTKIFTITGYNRNAVNYPIQGTDQDGKRYKFPAWQVLQALGRTVKTPTASLFQAPMLTGRSDNFGEGQDD